jgi:transposase
MKMISTNSVHETLTVKSKIGEAFGYYIKEREFLMNYLLDGRLEIDNGFTERGIRKFAIGRNNWMFSDTPRGADASAQLYSFVITAKMNNINPETALTKIFERVPYARNYEDYKTLADVLLYPDALTTLG